MSSANRKTKYHKLMDQSPTPEQPTPDAEFELDSLIATLKERSKESGSNGANKANDRIQQLRELTVNELVPVFVELAEKYAKSGISMQMDASNFLQGGREIKFEFGLGEYRSQLQGTVTREAIAFHETRHTPDLRGELTTGPMLRLRHLDGESFREFVCERLNALLRSAVRRR